MTEEIPPTSEWEHSHYLSVGDILVDENGQEFEVTDIYDDGSVQVRAESPMDGEPEHHTWTEEGVRTELVFGDLKRKRDGLWHELATY